MKHLGYFVALSLMALTTAICSAQTVSGSAVKDAIADYINKSIPASVETVVDFQNMQPGYTVGYKKYRLTVTSVNSVVLKGLVTFLVKASEVGREQGYEQAIPVTVRIRTFQNVLVSSQTIQPHALITPDEVTSVKTETTDILNPVTSLSQLEGKWTSRWIQSGKPLTFNMFHDVPVVKRGDNVTIIYRANNIVVQEQGSAVQDGRMNQIINVTNGYRDYLRGKVIGKGEVLLVN